MSWSLGETRALSVKATRATGFAWGLCEEAAYAVHWLQTANMPGVQALALYLEHLVTTGKHPHDLADTCPIQLGLKHADRKMDPAEFMGGVRQPILMVPFIANTRFAIEGVLSWDEFKCHIRQSGVNINAHGREYLVEAADCHWQGEACGDTNVDWVSRVPKSEKPYIQMLERLAVKTYAPSTEESRNKGAGAGTTDND